MNITTSGLIMISTLILSGIILQPVQAKGLKVFLTIDTNQRNQDASIETYQHGNQIDTRTGFINTGITELTLQYPEALVETGDFRICVRLYDGVEGCGIGYNSPEKKPEYVSVNIQRQQVLIDESNSGQSQSQSQSQSNENNNADSNSNTNTVIVCPPNEKCVIQR